MWVLSLMEALLMFALVVAWWVLRYLFAFLTVALWGLGQAYRGALGALGRYVRRRRNRLIWTVRAPAMQLDQALLPTVAEVSDILGCQPPERPVSLTLSATTPQRQAWTVQGQSERSVELLRELLLAGLPALSRLDHEEVQVVLTVQLAY